MGALGTCSTACCEQKSAYVHLTPIRASVWLTERVQQLRAHAAAVPDGAADTPLANGGKHPSTHPSTQKGKKFGCGRAATVLLWRLHTYTEEVSDQQRGGHSRPRLPAYN
eukprot:1138087-Pelagomonas_calceolata.AAC.3